MSHRPDQDPPTTFDPTRARTRDTATLVDDVDEFSTPIRRLGRDAREVQVAGNSGVDYSDPADHGLVHPLP